MNSAITGVYPWVGYEASERISVWTVAGYGAGSWFQRPSAPLIARWRWPPGAGPRAERQLQCVAPGGVSCNVACTMART